MDYEYITFTDPRQCVIVSIKNLALVLIVNCADYYALLSVCTNYVWPKIRQDLHGRYYGRGIIFAFTHKEKQGGQQFAIWKVIGNFRDD